MSELLSDHQEIAIDENHLGVYNSPAKLMAGFAIAPNGGRYGRDGAVRII
jgi:hypothetical protein